MLDSDTQISDEVDNHVDIAREFVSDQNLLCLYRSFVNIQVRHAYGADMDAGFDAGEFSGPAHMRAAEREVRGAIVAHGFGYDVDGTYDMLERIDMRVDHAAMDMDVQEDGPDMRGFGMPAR